MESRHATAVGPTTVGDPTAIGDAERPRRPASNRPTLETNRPTLETNRPTPGTEVADRG